MSVKISSQVWDKSQHSGSKLLLLIALADNANDNGHAWPGVDYLADKTRLSRDTVMRSTGTIEKSGELYIKRTKGRGNHYLMLTGCDEDERQRRWELFKIRVKIDTSSKLPPVASSATTPVASSATTPVAPMPPDPSVTITEPSDHTAAENAPADGDAPLYAIGTTLYHRSQQYVITAIVPQDGDGLQWYDLDCDGETARRTERDLEGYIMSQDDTPEQIAPRKHQDGARVKVRDNTEGIVQQAVYFEDAWHYDVLFDGDEHFGSGYHESDVWKPRKSKADKAQKPAKPEYWGDFLVEVRDAFHEPMGKATKIAEQLLGIAPKGERAMHNCQPPAQLGEAKDYAEWYAMQTDCDLATSAEALESWWHKFKTAGDGSNVVDDTFAKLESEGWIVDRASGQVIGVQQ